MLALLWASGICMQGLKGVYTMPLSCFQAMGGNRGRGARGIDENTSKESRVAAECRFSAILVL